MITVADILALPTFEQVDAIAPVEGAGERRVYNVGILDCPPEINRYSAYMPGEFILTNLGFSYDDLELSDASLIAMMERDVAAIAVKTVYRPRFTSAVAEASARLGVPVYLYDGAYHEQVTYQALHLIKRDQAASDKSDAVDALLNGRTRADVRREVSELAGLTGASMRCIAISAERDDRCSLYAVQDTLDDFLETFRQGHEEVEAACSFRYHDALLAFVSYRTEQPAPELYRDLERAIGRVGISHCGVGDLVPLGEADISIRQATILLAEAHVRDARHLAWTDLGQEAFSFAVQANPLFARTAHDFRAGLERRDRERGAELEETARAFARSFGDIGAAAGELHLHPNTVRYRLRTIRRLLGMGDVSEREFLIFLNLVFLG